MYQILISLYLITIIYLNLNDEVFKISFKSQSSVGGSKKNKIFSRKNKTRKNKTRKFRY